jgi:Tol biopolymer transport system component
MNAIAAQEIGEEISMTRWLILMTLCLAITSSSTARTQEMGELIKSTNRLGEVSKKEGWNFLVCDCWANMSLYIQGGRIEVIYPQRDVAKELGLPWHRDLDHFADSRLSPDGRSVVHVRRRSAAENDEAITIYSLTDKISKDLVRLSKSILKLSWSPSGKEIAFITQGDYESPGLSLSTINIANSDVKELIPRLSRLNPSAISWSPDGKRIAFQGGVSDKSQGFDPGIFVISLDTKKIAKIESANGNSPAWSPDGQLIAYITNDGKGCSAIRPDGTGMKKLFSHGDFGIFPSGDRLIGPLIWSPDMRYLIYHRTDGDGGRVYLFDLKRQKRKEIHSGWRVFIVDWRFEER